MFTQLSFGEGKTMIIKTYIPRLSDKISSALTVELFNSLEPVGFKQPSCTLFFLKFTAPELSLRIA
jgi:hypothetical protein